MRADELNAPSAPPIGNTATKHYNRALEVKRTNERKATLTYTNDVRKTYRVNRRLDPLINR